MGRLGPGCLPLPATLPLEAPLRIEPVLAPDSGQRLGAVITDMADPEAEAWQKHRLSIPWSLSHRFLA